MIENCSCRVLCVSGGWLWMQCCPAGLALLAALQMSYGAKAPFVVLQSPVSKALKGHCVHRQCLLCGCSR